MKNYISLAVALLIVLGCGQNTQSGIAAIATEPFDINNHWRVVSKTCKGTDAKILNGEEYRFDQSYVVRIHTAVDDSAMVVRMAYVFIKVTSNQSTSGSEIKESGKLQGTNIKSTTRFKKTPADAIDQKSDFDLRTGYALKINGNTAELIVDSFPDCAGREPMIVRLEK